LKRLIFFPAILLCICYTITTGKEKQSVAEHMVLKTEKMVHHESTHALQQNLEIGQFSIWLSKVKISGTLDCDFRWMNYNSIYKIYSATTSDLYLRLFDLGIEAPLLDWATATAVLNSEWIGDYLNQGDEKIAADEVHFDLQDADFPFYLIFGKRTQPFGLFENYLITDPLTQDAYET